MNDNDPSSPRPLSSDQSHRSELIVKLEEKTRQLEEMNCALQREIVHRKGIEEDLRKSEERFRATFEQAAVGIAHIAVDGRFLWMNDKLCEIAGYSREELLRLSFVELSAPQDRAEGEEARRAMLAGQRSSYSSEKSYLRKNGSLFWASVAITLSRTAAGEPDYFISIIADISERKKLDGQFLRAQRMESIGTLAGGIAH
ncbi:MAG: PAS domain S-box protein, partial [Verrucomicrobiota bacterium]